MLTHNMHVSNPNPQQDRNKQYRSVNQIGQDEPRNDAEKKMMQMLKFGRRVVFDKQMSNKDVLDNHLSTCTISTRQDFAIRMRPSGKNAITSTIASITTM